MVAYSFKKQFICPVQIGLGEPPAPDEEGIVAKRQTIRAIGKRRHARPGETVQLYYGMRTKQCRKIGEARCVSVDDIRIFVHKESIILPASTIEGAALDAFARSDGFADWLAMKQFWLDEHGDIAKLGPFVGVLIKWEPHHG